MNAGAVFVLLGTLAVAVVTAVWFWECNRNERARAEADRRRHRSRINRLEASLASLHGRDPSLAVEADIAWRRVWAVLRERYGVQEDDTCHYRPYNSLGASMGDLVVREAEALQGLGLHPLQAAAVGKLLASLHKAVEAQREAERGWLPTGDIEITPEGGFKVVAAGRSLMSPSPN